LPEDASIGLSLDDSVVIVNEPVISVVFGFLNPPRTTLNGLFKLVYADGKPPVIVTYKFSPIGLVTVQVALTELTVHPINSVWPVGNVTVVGNVIETLPPCSIVFLGVKVNVYDVGLLLVTFELGVTVAVSSEGEGVYIPDIDFSSIG